MTEVSATRLYLGNMPKGGKSAAFACPHRVVVVLVVVVLLLWVHVATCSAVPQPTDPASPHRASKRGAPVVNRR